MAGEVTQITFTATSSWLCPAGISLVFIDGCGGGGGGGSGGVPLNVGTTANSPASAGTAGGSAVRSCRWISVVPNTLYTITIGAGGAGGAGVAAGNGVGGNDGSDGSDTTFGSLATFKGAGKGYFGGSSNLVATISYCPGGACVSGANILKPANSSGISAAQLPIGVIQKPYEGGWVVTGAASTTTAWAGMSSPYGFAGGAAGANGTTSTTANCGLGGSGAAGSGFASAASATGGNGGNGNNAGAGGSAAAGKRQDGTTNTAVQTTNTGVGGAGGGSGGQGSGANNSGASGGGGGGDSGILILTIFQ